MIVISKELAKNIQIICDAALKYQGLAIAGTVEEVIKSFMIDPNELQTKTAPQTESKGKEEVEGTIITPEEVK